MITVLNDKDVKTRKAKRCCICNRRFEPGSVMNSQSYVGGESDGVNRSYCCMTCKALIAEHFLPMDEEEFGLYTMKSLEYGMDDDNFKGTPEEYLEFKRANKNKPKVEPIDNF